MKKRTGIFLLILIAGALAFSFFAPVYYEPQYVCYCGGNCYCGNDYGSLTLILIKHLGISVDGGVYQNSDGT
jgi:hypothetical protein